MNRLRTGETRRKVALGLTLAGGAVGLTGCGIPLDSGSPDLKPETKQQLTRIIKPKAVKIGGLTLEYAKKHPLESVITKDTGTKNGYEIDVDNIKSARNYTEITVNMKKINGHLDPATTYEVYIDSSSVIGDERYEGEDRLSTEEPPVYGGREVWYAEGYHDRLKNGKSELEAEGLPVSADSHINYPNDPSDVSNSLQYARDEAQAITTAYHNGFSGK